MTPAQATELVGMLVVTTTGWNDDSVEATCALMESSWHDPLAAREAVENVAGSWKQTSRPPWGVLADAYRSAARRHAMERPAIESGASGLVVSAAEGRRVAAAAYTKECRSRRPDDPLIASGWRTRKPNMKLLDSILGLIPEHADEAR